MNPRIFLIFVVAALGSASTELSTAAAALHARLSVSNYGAVCNGSTDDTAAIVAADAASQSMGYALEIPSGTCVITLSIPIASDLVFSGGMLSPAAGTTVTLNGSIIAGTRQHIFTGAGTIAFSGGNSSGLNVMWWGAKCNGTAADDAPVQAALVAAAAFQGTVLIPAGNTCLISGQLAMDGFKNVLFTSSTGNMTTSVTSYPRLLFTGTASPLMSAKSSFGLHFSGIDIQYNNPGFRGKVIDLSHGSSNLDTIGDSFGHMAIQGSSGAAGANCLVCGDKADSITIDDVIFEYAANAIQGGATGNAGTYAVKWTVKDCAFSNSTGTISNSMIQNPSQGWNITGNTFEMGTALSTTVSILDMTTLSCNGCEVSGNWAGDAGPAYTGVFIRNFGSGGVGGIDISGNNFISGPVPPNGTLMSIAPGSLAMGISIHGNYIGYFGLVLALGEGKHPDVHIGGNLLSNNVATFTGYPASGLITDYSADGYSSTTVYGASVNVRPLVTPFRAPISAYGRLISCAGANPCANVALNNYYTVFDGGVPLALGADGNTAVSGLPFTSGAPNSYGCFAWDISPVRPAPVTMTYNGSSVVTFTGAPAHPFRWMCMGQ